MSEHDQEAVLASLMPSKNQFVMDLVAEAGIDVRPWAVKKDGAPVVHPRANPNYCYEWAFGGGSEPVAFCVPHNLLKVEAGNIVYEDNVREFGNSSKLKTLEQGSSSAFKSRVTTRASRSARFDQRIAAAFRNNAPLRVILLGGSIADTLEGDKSSVDARRVDESAWWVDEYDQATGRYRWVRGSRPLGKPANRVEDTGTIGNAEYVDQFSVNAPVKRVQITGEVIVRSQDIRRRVLRRAAGLCECCGRQGFATAGGGIYLETHHVVPLCEYGPDNEGNVVALCPDDHRRAHFGEERDALRSKLLAKLDAFSSSTLRSN